MWGKNSANVTDAAAVSVHGTNPQNLIEKILRSKIYNHAYWKEHCFGLTAESLVDKAMEIEEVAGTFGGIREPAPFIQLILKMLQMQPEKEIVVEFIKNEDYKYVRALGAFYLRLTGRPAEVYQYLEPLYNDYRKVRRRLADGGWAIVRMDEFVEECLREDYLCDIALPHLPKREKLEQQGLLAGPRRSALEDELDEEEEALAAEAAAAAAAAPPPPPPPPKERRAPPPPPPPPRPRPAGGRRGGGDGRAERPPRPSRSRSRSRDRGRDDRRDRPPPRGRSPSPDRRRRRSPSPDRRRRRSPSPRAAARRRPAARRPAAAAARRRGAAAAAVAGAAAAAAAVPATRTAGVTRAERRGRGRGRAPARDRRRRGKLSLIQDICSINHATPLSRGSRSAPRGVAGGGASVKGSGGDFLVLAVPCVCSSANYFASTAGIGWPEAARRRPRKSGDAFIGRDLNSGWNWQPTKYGWFASSKTSIRSPVVSRPTNSRPFASSCLTYSMFTS